MIQHMQVDVMILSLELGAGWAVAGGGGGERKNAGRKNETTEPPPPPTSLQNKDNKERPASY